MILPPMSSALPSTFNRSFKVAGGCVAGVPMIPPRLDCTNPRRERFTDDALQPGSSSGHDGGMTRLQFRILRRWVRPLERDAHASRTVLELADDPDRPLGTGPLE